MKKQIKIFSFCLALSVILINFNTLNVKAFTCNEVVVNNSEFNDVNKSNINSQPNNNEEPIVQVFNTNERSLYITQSDIELMAKLVYAESRGEPFEGKVGVVSVVLNRVLNPSFPNTIKDVIFQKNAFSCVDNNDIIAYPDQNCYEAVYEALNGTDPTNDALFYYNPEISTCSWMNNVNKNDVCCIGHHIFFKN